MKKHLFGIFIVMWSLHISAQVTVISNSNMNGFTMGNIIGSPTRINVSNGVQIQGGFGTYSCTLDTILNLTCFDSLTVIFTISRQWGYSTCCSSTCSVNGIIASGTPTTYSYTTTNTSSLSFSIIVSYYSITGTPPAAYIQNLKILGYQSGTTCTVAPAQPAAITGPTAVCTGATANFFTPPLCGATSYNWLLPSGWTGTATANVISATTGSSGIFTVTASNACGTSPQQTLNVTIPNPIANAGPSQTITCATPTVNLSGSGVSSYTWSGPGIVSGANSATPGVNAGGTYSLVGSISGCSSIPQPLLLAQIQLRCRFQLQQAPMLPAQELRPH